MPSHDYNAKLVSELKQYLPRRLFNQLHLSARGHAGGKARHRKKDPAEVEKQLGPVNALGLTVAETLSKVESDGKFTQADANFVGQSDNPDMVCGNCRFFLRDEASEIGACQVVEGDIPWFAVSDLWIGATEEARAAYESISKASTNYDDETEKINENKKTAKAMKPHKFAAAEWTHKNGHPRCLICGDEERTDGSCEGRASEIAKGSKSFYVEFVKAEKLNDDERIVVGVVMVPEVVDAHGDVTSAKEIAKVIKRFNRRYRKFNIQHKGRDVSITMLKSYAAPANHVINGKDVVKGSWVLSSQIGQTGRRNKKLWADIKAGKITGYSIEGYAETAPA